MALRLRRGTDAERLLITPLEGELLYTTDTKKIYVGDGTTLGGVAFESGSLSINELIDVNTTEGDSTQPADGDALIWDGDQQWWRPGVVSGGGGATSLSDLTDVSSAVDSATERQILQFFSGSFTPQDLTLNTLDNVSTSPSADHYLFYTGAGWSSRSFSINDFANVQLSSTPKDGDVIRYNPGTSRYENLQLALQQLSDIRIDFSDSTRPQGGEALIWNADQAIWNPAPVVESDPNPRLGANLVLNSNNIQGSGNINITGNIVGSLVTAPVVNGVNLYGELQGSIRALDSSLVYDLLTDTLAASTLTTNEITSNTIATNTLEAADTAVLTFGSAATPTKLVGYSDDGDFVDFYGTTDSDSWVTVNSSNGTLSAPTVSSAGDFLSGLIVKGHDGSVYSRSSVIAGGVDPNGTVSAGVVPGIVYLINRDLTGGNIIASFDAAGTFTAPTIQPGVYADTTARDAAITSPSEGMMVFLTSTQKMQVYVSDTGLAAGGVSNSVADWYDMY